MNNTVLASILGVIAVFCIGAVTYILISPTTDKVVAIGLLAPMVGGFVTALLSFRQSTVNGEAQRITAAKVAAVAEQTFTVAALTEQVSVTAEQTRQAVNDVVAKVDTTAAVTGTTHQLVNSRMDEFKAGLRELSAMKVELAASKSELLAALALARGITIGRTQVQQEAAPAEGVHESPA
jgi:hypothetical protein